MGCATPLCGALPGKRCLAWTHRSLESDAWLRTETRCRNARCAACLAERGLALTHLARPLRAVRASQDLPHPNSPYHARPIPAAHCQDCRATRCLARTRPAYPDEEVPRQPSHALPCSAEPSTARASVDSRRSAELYRAAPWTAARCTAESGVASLARQSRSPPLSETPCSATASRTAQVGQYGRAVLMSSRTVNTVRAHFLS